MNAELHSGIERPVLGLTRSLANDVAELRFDELPADIVERARLCLLDWVGVTLAACNEPQIRLLIDEMLEAGGAAQSSLIGHDEMLPAAAAALVNGAAAHALDYDDANIALVGHPSAPLLAGLLALAERENASGEALIAAFVAGYELVCRLGGLLGPGHYERGHHTTATAGTVAAAAGCAKLLGLGPDGIATAMAIASTRAAGIRAMFGTVLKPLQVGFAASHGVLAAQLARRGLLGRQDALEAPAGLIAVIGDGSGENSPVPADGFHLRANLFKFHASCLLANAPAAAAARLREEGGFGPDDVRAVRLCVDPAVALICDDPRPATGLAMKFSVRAVVALAFAGHDTGAVEAFSDDNARSPTVVRLRDMVEVSFAPQSNDTVCQLEVELVDGRVLSVECDAGSHPESLSELRTKVEAKFGKLAMPVLGEARAHEFIAMSANFDALPNIAAIGTMWKPVKGGDQ